MPQKSRGGVGRQATERTASNAVAWMAGHRHTAGAVSWHVTALQLAFAHCSCRASDTSWCMQAFTLTTTCVLYLQGFLESSPRNECAFLSFMSLYEAAQECSKGRNEIWQRRVCADIHRPSADISRWRRDSARLGRQDTDSRGWQLEAKDVHASFYISRVVVVCMLHQVIVDGKLPANYSKLRFRVDVYTMRQWMHFIASHYATHEKHCGGRHVV
eukprot:4625216-Amphidinium_carterae.1